MLLRLLTGDRSLQSEAEIHYCSDSETLSVRNAAKSGWIGLFLPDTGLPPWLAVSEVLELPSRLNARLLRPTHESVGHVLEMLQLPAATLTKKPRELSLGTHHRVLLALALLYEPRFLFVDELLSSIDSPTVDAILPRLQTFIAHAGVACLLTTHDLDRALGLARTFYFKGFDVGLQRLSAPTKAQVLELFAANGHAA